MQGHRKSSCAPPDSGEAAEEDVLGIEELPKNLRALKIASPDFIRNREEENKAFIRDRRRKSAAPAMVPSDTMLSLDTTSNEVVARLLQPGIFDNTRVDETESTSRIIHWKETITPEPSKKTKIRQIMPCTLVTPTPDSSFLLNAPRSFQKAESPDPVVKPGPPYNSEKETSPSVSRHPLSRSMSADQRGTFMSKLTDQSAATVHVIPKADAEAIQSQAASLKFITHLVMSDDKNDPQALLVLGRDGSSVKDLVRKVEEENRRVGVNSKKGNSNLKAVAGAVVMGAVGTWAGLAFS